METSLSETRFAPTRSHDEFTDRLVSTAVHAACFAAGIQLRHFRDPAANSAKLLYDVKLATDRLCEEAIVAAIREVFPDHAILTEERGYISGGGNVVWIVDPLDGTVNFWHGLPFFCTSIACYRRDEACLSEPPQGLPGEPIAGVVYLPYSHELFVGIKGRGAFVNDQPIRVTSSTSPADMVVSVSFGKNRATMQRMTHRLDLLLPHIRKARCLGAAAAELAYASAGILGGLFYEGLKLWDFAAAKIILEEAGGFFRADEIEPDTWRVIAGAQSIRESLEMLLRR
jgi:fructose-1,6-bisphosphatase/inositol monophosphatase family enzyme